MIIPRERISPKQVLTRVYCQMEYVESEPSITTSGSATTGETMADAAASKAGIQAAKEKAKKCREKVTLKRIIEQTKKVLEPYNIEFHQVDWWVSSLAPSLFLITTAR